MNYPVLIVVALAGIALGMYLALCPSVASRGGGRRGEGGLISKPFDHAQGKQTEQKAENKQKILAFVQEHQQIQNNDVEKLVGVSDATAGRYLEELEEEGRLIQHGSIGQGVFYTLK